MKLAKITGTVVATRKDESLVGYVYDHLQIIAVMVNLSAKKKWQLTMWAPVSVRQFSLARVLLSAWMRRSGRP